MKVSTKGRYALRVMLDLARYSESGLVPLKDISRRQGITIKYMEQIISPLARAGLVSSLRGSSGGYRLTRKPSEYTCGEILRVMEGPLVPTACLEGECFVDCARAEECPTLTFWKGLSDVVNSYVDSVTLEKLLEEQDETGGDYVI